MTRGRAAQTGGAVGAAIGIVLLIATHPAAAYTNDAYRSGASFGFVLRYAILGALAGLSVRVFQAGRQTVLAGLSLIVILALAILPPVLDKKSPSEKRRADATAIDDPVERQAAESKAGAIDGCVNSTKRELAGTPDEKKLDPDRYCSCFVAALTAGPGDDMTELRAATTDLQAGRASEAVMESARRCLQQAQSE
jgi:hypothetical protein